MLRETFIDDLATKWLELHLKELLAEMDTQAKAINATK